MESFQQKNRFTACSNAVQNKSQINPSIEAKWSSVVAFLQPNVCAISKKAEIPRCSRLAFCDKIVEKIA